jgi:predicted aconitase
METFETALAAAIVGLTPERGLHLEENRQGTVVVIVDDANLDPDLLGWAISRTVPGEVPIVCGHRWGFDQAKRLAFSMNSEGSIPLFHLSRQDAPPSGLERVHIERRQLEEAFPPVTGCTPDLVLIGCPHLSEQEINKWALRSSGLKTDRPELWFFTSPLCMEKSPRSGAALAIVGQVMVGCCPLHTLDEMQGRVVGCTSPALAYCLQRRGVKVHYLSENDLHRLFSIK